MNTNLRTIQAKDNEQVAKLIKTVMTEFDCVGDGYSINDPEVENIFEAYSKDRHAFWVIESEDKILGCGGIGQLEGADESICELKKMYFYSELRGKGWGRKMVETCLAKAKEWGYQTCYIETVDRMTDALRLYKKVGFTILEKRVGDTGHCSCESFLAKEL